VFQFITKTYLGRGVRVGENLKKQSSFHVLGSGAILAQVNTTVIFGFLKPKLRAVSSRPSPLPRQRRKETRQLVVPRVALAPIEICDPTPWVTAVRAAPVWLTAPHPARSESFKRNAAELDANGFIQELSRSASMRSTMR